ncbi:FAD-dependent oxidoreductase [Chimaeribacter coloradensis]|uniref:FAD-dependent oxidoreductase n=1 Tax=Chimaeribacter coloradensis TaxID=2060068 RepID=A0A2N5DTZ1_9GAMM|nr:FAD-dependent oxidoreductase [Chimaeribacter coloradensis]PLR30177.1 FAD-dependent oxidoreductase [Chimaeribacter coloradensis]
MAKPRVVIIGGGFTGTALAIHLARLSPEGLAITLVEPRPLPGHGVAYSAQDPAHRINVPAGRMFLSAAEQGEFERWYQSSPAFADDPAAHWEDGKLYPQRAAFGRFVAEKFFEAAATTPSTLRHLRDRATRLHGCTVETAGGIELRAEAVVLAISHPPPALPGSVAHALGNSPALIADPWLPGALDAIGERERVAVIGTGLSMADVVASLHRRGHRGPLIAFSRRGLLPRPNARGDYAPWPFLPATLPQLSLRGWLRRTRQEIAAAAELGVSWQAVLDEVRARGQQIWPSLSLKDQKQFLRHLRPWWDVHRYRIAPQVAAAIGNAQAEGRLQVLAARLQHLAPHGDAVTLSLQLRHGGTQQHQVDRVIVTTGPAHGALLESQPLLHQLERQGVLQADPLGLGILVNGHAETLNRQGEANPRLLVAGPAARGRFGELMGLPQVAEHAEAVARRLLHNLHTGGRCPASR